MKGDCIHYAEGYKFQLRRTYEVMTRVRPKTTVGNGWLRLDPDGKLTISEGYAWDGTSGPTLETKKGIRGSLVHDAFFQLIREGLITMAEVQLADDEYRHIMLEDGLWAPRAWWRYLGVSWFGGRYADPAAISPDQCAPGGACCGPQASPVELVDQQVREARGPG